MMKFACVLALWLFAPGLGRAFAGEANPGPGTSTQALSSMVLIETPNGRGSGFITRLRGVDFVVTNLHVVGGAEKLTLTTPAGDDLKTDAVFGAVGRDVAILRLTSPRAGLEPAEDVLAMASIGDGVRVMGNTLGGGVVTDIRGKVTGIGADRIEVDAKFLPGNSGSPVLHAVSGKVIGIASYIAQDAPPDGSPLHDLLKGAGDFSGPRWFAFRLDGVSRWERIDARRWREQEKKLKEFGGDSLALVQLLSGRREEAMNHTRIRTAFDRMERSVGQSATRDEAGYRVAGLIQELKSMSDGGVRDLEHGDYYDYFRSNRYWETSIPMQLELRKRVREVMAKAGTDFSVFRSNLN